MIHVKSSDFKTGLVKHRFLREESEAAGPGNGLEVQNLFNISILNALWKIISGTRYDYRDPQLVDLTR